MSYGPTYYPTKGACIYCGANDSPLTDEHIVPYALGGVHVLREASCKKCAAVTSSFELKVARDLWGHARTCFDAPSRRKKRRAELIHMIEPGGLKIQVPVSDYPAGLVFYKMDLPGFLQKVEKSADISKSWKLIMVEDDQRRENFLKKNLGKLTLTFRNVPQEFGRLLAKIGYGQILTVLDPGDFHPICLPYIMGTELNVSYIVGGTEVETPPTPGIGYFLNTEGRISVDHLLLIAKVRLYVNTHSPEYQIIVGDVSGEANVARVAKKMGISPPCPSHI